MKLCRLQTCVWTYRLPYRVKESQKVKINCYILTYSCEIWGFPGSWGGKESACKARNPISVPELGRWPGEGTGSPLQDSWACLLAQKVKIYLQCGRPGFSPWVGKISWRRAWQPKPVFLPGDSPWTEEPGRLQSRGSQRVGHDWATRQRTAQRTWNLENIVRWIFLQSRNRYADMENKCMDAKWVRGDKLKDWDWHIYTTMYKIVN